jgi:Tol biopolymer transport system component
MILLRAVLLIALLAAATAPSASASFPGRNGNFAATVEQCPQGENDDGDVRLVRAYSPSGKAAGDLTDCTADVYGPTWSADGARLGFGQAGGGAFQYGTAAADGSDVRGISSPSSSAGAAGSGFFGPSFSLDGKNVAFTFGEEIWRSRLDGSQPKRLLRRPCKGSRECAALDGPRWSPDGRMIAVEVETFLSGSKLKAGIWLIRASDGKPIRRLGKGGSVDWSPDSRRLVFASSFEHGEDGRAKGGNLYTVRADGKGKPRRVARTKTTALTSPAWSPDGKSIAYIELKFTAGDVGFAVIPTVFRSPAGGGKRRRIVRLPRPFVEEGDYKAPTLAWQSRPRR